MEHLPNVSPMVVFVQEEVLKADDVDPAFLNLGNELFRIEDRRNDYFAREISTEFNPASIRDQDLNGFSEGKHQLEIAGFAGINVDDSVFRDKPFENVPGFLCLPSVGLSHYENVHPVFGNDLFEEFIPERRMKELLDILFGESTFAAGFQEPRRDRSHG